MGSRGGSPAPCTSWPPLRPSTVVIRVERSPCAPGAQHIGTLGLARGLVPGTSLSAAGQAVAWGWEQGRRSVLVWECERLCKQLVTHNVAMLLRCPALLPPTEKFLMAPRRLAPAGPSLHCHGWGLPRDRVKSCREAALTPFHPTCALLACCQPRPGVHRVRCSLGVCLRRPWPALQLSTGSAGHQGAGCLSRDASLLEVEGDGPRQGAGPQPPGPHRRGRGGCPHPRLFPRSPWCFL
jgi:hypothetical protein